MTKKMNKNYDPNKGKLPSFSGDFCVIGERRTEYKLNPGFENFMFPTARMNHVSVGGKGTYLEAVCAYIRIDGNPAIEFISQEEGEAYGKLVLDEQTFEALCKSYLEYLKTKRQKTIA